MYHQPLASFGPFPAARVRSAASLNAERTAERRFRDSVLTCPQLSGEPGWDAVLIAPGEGTIAQCAEFMRRHLDCAAVVATIAQPVASLIEGGALGEASPVLSHVCATAPAVGRAEWGKKALVDPSRLADPIAAGDLGFEFYAGVPLRLSSGCNVGTLAAVDVSPRNFGKDELARLKMLANIIVQIIEFHLATR